MYRRLSRCCRKLRQRAVEVEDDGEPRPSNKAGDLGQVVKYPSRVYLLPPLVEVGVRAVVFDRSRGGISGEIAVEFKPLKRLHRGLKRF